MQKPHPKPDNKGVVLKKAILSILDKWEIGQKEIAEILGVSESTISRIINKNESIINPSSNEGEKALYVVRVFRSLDSFLGSNNYENQKQWLKSNNKFFNATPLEAMKSMEGLVHVVNYLGTMRGKY